MIVHKEVDGCESYILKNLDDLQSSRIFDCGNNGNHCIQQLRKRIMHVIHKNCALLEIFEMKH
jgi:hypothetical protein